MRLPLLLLCGTVAATGSKPSKSSASAPRSKVSDAEHALRVRVAELETQNAALRDGVCNGIVETPGPPDPATQQARRHPAPRPAPRPAPPKPEEGDPPKPGARVRNKLGDTAFGYTINTTGLSTRFTRSLAFLRTGVNVVLFGDSNDREARLWLLAKVYCAVYHEPKQGEAPEVRASERGEHAPGTFPLSDERARSRPKCFKKHKFKTSEIASYEPASLYADEPAGNPFAAARAEPWSEGVRLIRSFLSEFEPFGVLNLFHFGVLADQPEFARLEWYAKKRRQGYDASRAQLPANALDRARFLAPAVSRRLFEAHPEARARGWCVVANSLLWDYVPFEHEPPEVRASATAAWRARVRELARAVREGFGAPAALTIGGHAPKRVTFAWRSGSACPVDDPPRAYSAPMVEADAWIGEQIRARNGTWADFAHADWRAAEVALDDVEPCDSIHKASYESYWVAVAEACGCRDCGA